MSLGISTACFYPLETEEALKLIVEQNIACTEIFFNAKKELNNSFVYFLSDILKGTKTKITALHPMLSLAEPYNIFSEYQRRFDESLDDFKRYFEVAAMLGAKYVNLHGDKKTGKLSVEEYCERFFLLSEEAESTGVILCQENVNGYRSADPEFLSEISNLLGDKVSFTLDIKQCIRAGYTPTEIINAMHGKIKHLHISDHSAASDCLLPLKGGFDFLTLFHTLEKNGYTGDYLIEVYQNAYTDYSEIFESCKKLSSLRQR